MWMEMHTALLFQTHAFESWNFLWSYQNTYIHGLSIDANLTFVAGCADLLMMFQINRLGIRLRKGVYNYWVWYDEESKATNIEEWCIRHSGTHLI